MAFPVLCLLWGIFIARGSGDVSGRVRAFCLLVIFCVGGGEDLVGGSSFSESDEEADSYSESDVSVSVCC